MVKKRKDKWWIWGVWLGVWGIFWVIGINVLDPDLGWHLRMGEVIFASGVPKTDPFSYTMPSYPFVDHEWLTNVIMARLYPVLGMVGLAAVMAGVSTLALMTAVPVEWWNWAVVPLLLGMGGLMVRGGARPQVEDWLFLAITLRLTESKKWQRLRWLIPVLFGWWANLHGGFMLGPVILAVVLGVKFWEQRKIELLDVMVWCLGVVATLINPYGVRLWHEVWMQMTDMGLRNSIAEWQVFMMRLELGWWLLIALVAVLAMKYGEEIEKREWAVWGLLLVAGLLNSRHAALFTVAAIPVAAKLLGKAYEEMKKKKVMRERARKFYGILVGVAGVLLVVEVGLLIRGMGAGSGAMYPQGAINFLRANKFEGELFSKYWWGGYLIWKLPEKKVFIDGRMPSWRWTAPSGESNWAFKEYLLVGSGNEADIRDVFNKYRVGVVLWSSDQEWGGNRWWI